MSNFNETLEQLILEIKEINTIELEKIPNIDLYMDQVTTFMEDNLNYFKRSKEDKILTKTMINNYTKAKIFPPPVKKKYTKNHIMLLIIIYHLKSILSINDINRLLKPVTDELKVGEHSKTLETIYKNFVILQNNNKKNISSKLTEEPIPFETDSIESLENKTEIKLILTVLFLTIQSNTEKRLSEKIIDKFF